MKNTTTLPAISKRGNRKHRAQSRGAAEQTRNIFALLLDLFKPRRVLKKHHTKPMEQLAHDPLTHLAVTCSIVALHAELAKLKGTLSAQAFLEFRCLFPIGDMESKNLRYLFKLAWEEQPSKSSHLRYIIQHYPTQSQIHKRIVEGLARQLLASESPSKQELDWLHEVAETLGITRVSMRQILTRAEQPMEAAPYRLFNLPKSASHEQIKHAYRRVMMVCHPDKVTEAHFPETRAAAEKISTAATLAYSQLKSSRTLHRRRA